MYGIAIVEIMHLFVSWFNYFLSILGSDFMHATRCPPSSSKYRTYV